MELLRTEHLCKVYRTGENQVHALRDVSFSVEKGEFVAIIGQSGSGKSTLLHMIGGVDVPHPAMYGWMEAMYIPGTGRNWPYSGAGRWG